ncbi:MAG: GGDEF domain-containing protein [Thalassotalea sp.]
MATLAQSQIGVISTSPQASKIKITNIVSYFTCAVALFYALYFWLSLQQPFLAGLNLLFVFGYAISLVLSKSGFYKIAKYWFFTMLLVHVYVLTTLVFSPSAGFHFYYLLLPTGVFLLLDEKDKVAKVVIMSLGAGLFFLCHNSNNQPLIELSIEAEYWIFASTIIVIMTEIYFVMSVFSQAITIHEKELQAMATTDGLTGVNNRRSFMMVGDEMFSSAERYKQLFSVMIIDIDHFKNINDSYGHKMGDDILKIVAQTLKNNIRKSDVLARYGGEEFVILLPETSLNDGYDLANLLRTKISDLTIATENENITCTASFGVAQYHQQHNLSELVNAADQALYEAKASGRNIVKSYLLPAAI